MIKNHYKYDEFRYADIIYREGFQTKYLQTELCLLAKYYRDVLNVKPKDLKQKIKLFCEKHIKDYEHVLYFRTINKAVNQKKCPTLASVSHIDVYEGEINYIDSLDIPYDCKKLLFTFMVYMKLDNQYKELKYGSQHKNIIFKGNSQKYNFITQISNLNQSFKLNMEAIPLLSEKKLIKLLYRGKFILEFLKKCEKTGKIVLKVFDYDNIGWYYDYYHGKKRVILCKECEQPFRKNSNKQCYCKKCAYIVHRKKALEHHYDAIAK